MSSSYSEQHASQFTSPYSIEGKGVTFDASQSILTSRVSNALHPEVQFDLRIHFYNDGTSRITLDQGGERYKDWKRFDQAAAWAIDEQCVVYQECEPFQAYIKANKPVFHLEYTAKSNPPASLVQKYCNGPGTSGFSTLIKHLSLNAWTKTCP